jgi:hypothetical protein
LSTILSGGAESAGASCRFTLEDGFLARVVIFVDGGKVASFSEMEFEFQWNSTEIPDCCQIFTRCQSSPWLLGFARLDQCVREHSLSDNSHHSFRSETTQRTMNSTHDETWRAGNVTATEEFTGCMVVESSVIRSLDRCVAGVAGTEDWQGDWLLPGLADLHTENLENIWCRAPACSGTLTPQP